MTDTSHDIRTLNGLIATTIDSVDGYRTSAEAVDSSRFADQFKARADERSSVAESLRAEVSRLGGNAEDDGTLLAAGHRAFVNLKGAVTSRDDQAIVNEVERGEDHIKAKFESALEDRDLSSETRSAIELAFTSVKSGHDEMSNLKHQLEAHEGETR
ncbi:MAG: PA2169 family four-helix-bundle protein [Sphingomonas sp.]|uniref:PA2169 family four-helix-bundle protein n=1 Tax=Sphingomonas sp. TaxID=28214 RepID=UPI00180CEE1E|nr:PA2169 family four-helix-bundle protein [Sphingomonas sp.]MBA3668228.1 PA2169 family four-helix-bundle protein [Sphingomonas sp.]